ncbi:MAG: SusD/RagB family nutrient-binding outer membrane lipoprotein, partial [Saprospiraceae bacterium]|nr:SusD/RagB family nutrient-binding outer membrane lipoprotein [Saprospiraceae bacterium]
MSLKYIIKNACIVCTIFILSSCSDFLDVNDDPNNPTSVDPEVVLAVAQASVGGTIGGDFSIIGGLWSQHWTQSHTANQYRRLDSYDLVADDYNVSWNEMYAGGLNDLELIKRGATESGNWNLYLQATVTQAYGFQIMADFFDKIPYTEALKGVENFSPAYDDGQVVYDGLITALNEALAKNFDGPNVKYIFQDLVFPLGNKDDQVSAWKKFANTLKLKIYLRQTESSRSAEALAAINAMLQSGTEFLDEDAAITQFVDEPNKSNFLYENNVRQLNVGTNLRMSRTIESFLESNNDLARQNAYFNPGNTGQYGLVQGNFNALTSVIGVNQVSSVKISALDPFYFISLDESLFLQAEAVLRTGGDARNLYNQAVSAAYHKFGLSVPATFLEAGGTYGYPSSGSTAEKLKAIMTQKWVAMFKQGWESFFDQVRTGIPAYSPVAAEDPAYVAGQ